MSRFVQVELALGTLDEVERALAGLGVVVERGDGPRALRGGIECGDEPVAMRIAAGAFDAVEDFGFVADDAGQAVLVCGEPDRRHLQRRLLPELSAALAQLRVAHEQGLEVIAIERSTDGAVRLRVQPRRG